MNIASPVTKSPADLLRTLAVSVLLVFPPLAGAVPPPGILNHQGRIIVGGENYTGTGYFKFALVDAAGTVRYWSNNNSGTGGGQPTAAVQTTVSQGLYALGLGDATLANMTVIPAAVFADNADVRLRIWFSPNNTTFEQLTPDRRLTAGAYALSAATVSDTGVARLAGNQTFSGTLTAPGFTGSGTGLTGVALLGAGNTFTGNQTISGTVAASGFTGSGINLTGVAKLAGGNAFTGNQTNTGTVTASGFNGSGTGLTGVALLGVGNTFTGNQTISGTVAASGFTGSGTSLTGVAKLAGGNAFTGNQTNTGTVTAASFSGPGGAALALGSTGAQPVELSVNGLTALRLLPGTGADEPNLIGGSSLNTMGAGSSRSVIGGGGGPGEPNQIVPGVTGATVAGGVNNTAGGNATVGGGIGNIATGSGSTVAGGDGNRAEIVRATVGGGFHNTASNDSATIGGGYENVASGDSSTVAGGWANQVVGATSAVGGGYNNVIAATAARSTIGGGSDNEITLDDATIGGGYDNTAGGDSATVAGGWLNNASGTAAAIGGGYGNNAAGVDSMIPGGFNCSAAGNYSFAAGSRAKALHMGAWVWADGQDVDFASTGAHQFLIRATGNVGINKNNPTATLDVNGTIAAGGTVTADAAGGNAGNHTTGPGLRLGGTGSGEGIFSRRTAGAGQFALDFTTNFTTRLTIANGGAVTVVGNCFAQSFTPTSDRNTKENFTPVDPQEVLAKVAALPVTRWNFKTDPGTAHIGPMAQDFYAAFAAGPDDRHIATVDADGVALAAIQGLNQKLERGLHAAGESKDKELAALGTKVASLTEANDTLTRENSEMKARLERLEKVVAALAGETPAAPAAKLTAQGGIAK